MNGMSNMMTNIVSGFSKALAGASDYKPNAETAKGVLYPIAGVTLLSLGVWGYRRMASQDSKDFKEAMQTEAGKAKAVVANALRDGAAVATVAAAVPGKDGLCTRASLGFGLGFSGSIVRNMFSNYSWLGYNLAQSSKGNDFQRVRSSSGEFGSMQS